MAKQNKALLILCLMVSLTSCQKKQEPVQKTCSWTVELRYYRWSIQPRAFMDSGQSIEWKNLCKDVAISYADKQWTDSCVMGNYTTTFKTIVHD